MSQLTFALSARDEALERLAEQADADWKARAYAAVLMTAFDRGAAGFIADDVWTYLDLPPQPKALGAVLMRLAREKRIVPTGEVRPHPKRHATKTTVWRLA